MKKANIKNTAIFAALFCAIFFCACKNIYKSAEQKTRGILKAKIALPDTYEAFQNAARSALPSGFGNALVFAGAVTQNGNPVSADLKIGTFNSTNNTLELPFSISASDRADYKLDIYAFVNADDVSDKNKAILHGQTSISILAYEGNADVGGEIKMRSYTNSSGVKGSVDLKLSIPAGYTLSAECKTHSSEIISTEKDEEHSNDENCLYKITGELASGAHSVNFIVKKSNVIVHAWNEALNVFPGLATNKWTNVDASGVRQIQSLDNTFYVRGTPASGNDRDSWFADFTDTLGDDLNSGSLTAPFKTVQKAIDTVVAINDTKSEYTIYVDGVFTAQDGCAVAAFTNLDDEKKLALTIASLQDNAKFVGTNWTVVESNTSARKLNLTLKNISITGGNADNGGGIYISDGCTVTLDNCEISGNTSSGNGGAIYNAGTLKMQGNVNIPCAGEKQNDIYLPAGKTIAIVGNLAGTAPVTITPSSYARGTQVLKAVNSDLMARNFNKFRLCNADYAIKPDGTNGIIVASGMSGTVTIPKAYTFKAFKNNAALFATDTFSTNDVFTFKVYDGTEEVAASKITSFKIEARQGGSDISSVFAGMVQNSTYSDAKIIIPKALVDFADYIDAYISVTIDGSVYDYTVPIKISSVNIVSADNAADYIDTLIAAGTIDLNIKITGVTESNIVEIANKLKTVTGLDSVRLTLEGSLTTIPTDTFRATSYYYRLKSVVLPTTLQIIEDNAFYNCKGLSYIVIPASVTEIGGTAFNYSGLANAKFEHYAWGYSTNSSVDFDFSDSVYAASRLKNYATTEGNYFIKK